MMNARARMVFPLLVATLVVLLLAAGWLVYGYDAMVMTFPVIAGVATIVLCLVVARRGRWVAPPGDGGRRPLPEGAAPLLRAMLIVPAIILLGLPAGAGAWVALSLAGDGVRWPVALAAGVIAAAILHLLFAVVMHQPLPPALLFGF